MDKRGLVDVEARVMVPCGQRRADLHVGGLAAAGLHGRHHQRGVLGAAERERVHDLAGRRQRRRGGAHHGLQLGIARRAARLAHDAEFDGDAVHVGGGAGGAESLGGHEGVDGAGGAADLRLD